MIIKEEIGDLFELENTHTLVHCISRDCAMGAGIALVFKERYPGLQKNTIDYLKNVDCGCKAIGVNVKNYKIINLITKEKYNDKPTYNSLTMSLIAMRDICIFNKISKIAMPTIGCGLDRLEWIEVLSIIKGVFQYSNIEIVVRVKE